MRRSKYIALTSVFGGLAILTSISGLSRVLVYPLVPYLKFDPAEIFIVIAYLIGGLHVGLTTSFIHLAGLMLLADEPIGPVMKFLAVASMLLGLEISGRLGLDRLKRYLLTTGLRVSAMTLVNAVVLYFLFPGFLEFFNGYVSSLGLEGAFAALFLALILTGIYNAIHTVFTLLPSEAVVAKILPIISPVSPLRHRGDEPLDS